MPCIVILHNKALNPHFQYYANRFYESILHFPTVLIIEKYKNKSTAFWQFSFPLAEGYCKHWSYAEKKFVVHRFCTS